MHLSLIVLALLTPNLELGAWASGYVIFHRMIGGGWIGDGDSSIYLTRTQAHDMIDAFEHTTISSNQHTIGMDVSVAGQLRGTFDIGADFSYRGDFIRTSSSSSSYSVTSKWEERLEQNITVPDGHIYMVLAEMRLYPYDVIGGGRKYFVLAGGPESVWSGSFGADDLRNQILDDSMAFFAREFGRTIKTWPEIAAEATNVPQISPNLESPIPGVFYRIKNTMYPGTRLGGGGHEKAFTSCGDWDDTPDQLWRFEPFRNGYFYIWNKRWSNHRLAITGRTSWGMTNDRIHYNQLFLLTNEGSNRFRITSYYLPWGVKWFGQGSRTSCGFGGESNNWVVNDKDQIWYLEEEY